MLLLVGLIQNNVLSYYSQVKNKSNCAPLGGGGDVATIYHHEYKDFLSTQSNGPGQMNLSFLVTPTLDVQVLSIANIKKCKNFGKFLLKKQS